jgi:hypothetical protein
MKTIPKMLEMELPGGNSEVEINFVFFFPESSKTENDRENIGRHEAQVLYSQHSIFGPIS